MLWQPENFVSSFNDVTKISLSREDCDNYEHPDPI